MTLLGDQMEPWPQLLSEGQVGRETRGSAAPLTRHQGEAWPQVETGEVGTCAIRGCGLWATPGATLYLLVLAVSLLLGVGSNPDCAPYSLRTNNLCCSVPIFLLQSEGSKSCTAQGCSQGLTAPVKARAQCPMTADGATDPRSAHSIRGHEVSAAVLINDPLMNTVCPTVQTRN